MIGMMIRAAKKSNMMKIGDLVCDPHVMKSKYGYIIDRSQGIIVGTSSDRNFEPPSYCDCYKDKFLVWWSESTGSGHTVFEQCECELEVINESW